MNGKLLKWIAVTLGCIAVLLAAYLLLNREQTLEESDLVFIDREPTEIENVTIANSYGAYQVFRDGDGYTIADMPASIIDEEGFYELMYHSCAFGALKVIDEAPADLSVYGLDDPAAIVRTVFADGEEITIRLGSEERVSGNYYGMVDGKESVYLFAEEDVLYFLLRKEIYISLQVTPELVVSSPLSAIRDITFSGTALPEPITVEAVTDGNPALKREALSFGAPTHIVRLRGVYQLDQTYGVEMLGSVMGIRALSVYAYNMSDGDLAKMGFDDPYMRVSFGLKNGTDYIADFELSLIPYGEYYLASTKGTGLVFIIERPDFVGIDGTKLCLRWFLMPLRKDLKDLTVSFGGEDYVFTSGTDQSGNNWGRVNGQEMDIEQFYAFYRLVTGASSDGLYLEDAVSEGEPLMTVTYRYLDEGKTPDVMKLYTGGTRRVNVEVNGVTEFDMRSSFVDAVKAACQNAVSGEAINENW